MATLVDSVSDLVETVNRTTGDQNAFLLRWQNEAYSQLLRQAEEININRIVKEKGLMPFLADPSAQIIREIQTIQENLGCSEAEAVAYIRKGLAEAMRDRGAVER